MKYFKSFYKSGLAYSQGWYGTLSYAPEATVLLYNDTEGFCIGIIEETIEGIEYITEQEALSEISNADLNDSNIWIGDRLVSRWDVNING